MDKAHIPTIHDVAAASGVSYSTVSRVMNGFEFVKADTRERVLVAAKTLGYVANLKARALAGGKSGVVGLLVPSFGNGYVSAICQGIDEALAQAGYDLMLYTTHRQQDKEAKYARATAGGMTDGLLLMVPLLTSSQLESNYLATLRQQNFPYVLIDQEDPSGKSTIVDSTNQQGTYEAVSYLIGLGHERIGFITGDMRLNASKERLKGYQNALRANLIGVDDELIAEGDFSHDAGYRAAAVLFSLSEVPTALFASNDISALGAMEAVREKGLTVPDDISVVGFDDIPQASMTYPKLTTVRQPLKQMGSAAVSLLLAKIKDPDKPLERVTLATELVARDSCCAPSG